MVGETRGIALDARSDMRGRRVWMIEDEAVF